MSKIPNYRQYLFLLLCLFYSINTVAENTNIAQPVIELHDALLNNMKLAETSDFQQRYENLETIVKTHFDTPLIAKVILGRYWQELDNDAQQEFINLFDELTIATYASRFDSYSDENFNTVSIEPMRKERYLVKTELTTNEDKPVSLDYIVQKNGASWKIISVIANGVNDLSLKRAEYNSVIKDKGYDTLVSEIRTKIDELGS